MFFAGYVYLFSSPKVKAGESKLQLCIRHSPALFLLINSNPFPGSFKITKKDWAKMHNNESYVSCNSPIRYTDTEITIILTKKPRLLGRFAKNSLAALSQHIMECEEMTESNITEIVPLLSAIT